MIKESIQFLKNLFDFIVPRFITEDVALIDNGEKLEIACPFDRIEDGVNYAGIVSVSSFTFLGRAFFVKQVGEVRPFEVWQVSECSCRNCGKSWVLVHEKEDTARKCPDCGSIQIRSKLTE